MYVPNSSSFISIDIWGWMHANKLNNLFGPKHAARVTKQHANSGMWLIPDAQVISHHCASEPQIEPGYQTRPMSFGSWREHWCDMI
jgi:hypothetical protein